MTENNKVSMVGRHRAKVIDSEFGYSGDDPRDQKPQVALMFELVEEGALKGRTISWFGYFTPSAQDRTFDSLRYCGWDSDDLEVLGDVAQRTGVYRNEVEIVVEEEEYQGKKRLKVRWINRPGKRELDLKNKMSSDALKAFAAQMKSAAKARREEDPSKRFQQRAQQRSFDDPYPAERDWQPDDADGPGF